MTSDVVAADGFVGAAPTVVTVLVPVLNEETHLEAALERMLAQDFERGIEFLLIDGGSADATRAIAEAAAQRDPRVRVLDNPDRYTPNALNIGLAAARGEYVARMDAHTHYPPNYISSAVERLRRGDVDWVAGPQLAAGDGSWSRRVALALSSRLGTGAAGFRQELGEERETDSGFTGVWLRSTLERHGGWDEGWPINQDAELAARILASGGRILCLPELRATYIARDSLKRLARQYWRYGMYRAKTSRRHPHSMRRSHLLAPGLAVATTTAVAGPRRLRRLARLPLGVYSLATVASSAAAVRRAPATDVMTLPLVFATMHLAWGYGFLLGCMRFGPPLAALRRMLPRRARGEPPADRN